MAKLNIKDEHGKERVHELIDEVTTVGRASLNVIQISDEKASRQHFRIEKQAGNGVFKIVDLGSTNGTRLNGSRIQSDTTLRPGDKISVGKTVFLYDGPPEQAPAAEKAASSGEIGGEAAAVAPLALGVAPVPVSPGPALGQDAPTQQDEAGPKYILRVLEGRNSGGSYPLGLKPLTLGRSSSNTIQIDDDAASNYHAEISREPIGYVLTDLGSTNGTRVKVKNKPDFEKIVKTPLSPGMQIRVGKTLLEFQNIGQPVEDNAHFGTVELDPQKLEEKLAEPPRKPNMILVGGAAALLFAGIVAGIVWLAGPAGKPGNPDPQVESPDTGNRIANGDFSDGTDDEGNPRNFAVAKASSAVKVAVVAAADHSPPGKEPRGLQITKKARSAAALTTVDTSVAVTPGKVYEFSGWMKNEGDGRLGLRVVWEQGERHLADSSFAVLKENQEWKLKRATLTAPQWAQRARVGVFAEGRDGIACFDDLSFSEKPEGLPAQLPSVKFGAMTLHFEAAHGVFSATSRGERVIEDGLLQLAGADENSVSDTTSAFEPQAKPDAAHAVISGRIYDYASQDWTDYKIDAQPGQSGVEFSAAIDNLQATGSKPRLSFDVVGSVSQGDIEITRAGDPAPEKMLAAEGEKTFSAVQEVVFNTGKEPQLVLAFPGSPVDLSIRREGNRRAVSISFKGKLRLALSPESAVQKLQMNLAIEDLRRSLDARKWGECEPKIAALREKFTRLPQAREEAAKAEGKLEAAWKLVLDDVKSAMDSIQPPRVQVPTPELIALASQTIARHRPEWIGSSHEKDLEANLARLTEITKAADWAKAEQDADKLLQEAEKNAAIPQIADSYLRKILEDPRLKDTAAGKKAQEKMAAVQATLKRRLEIKSLTEKLQQKAGNYSAAGDTKGAIDAIEKDKDYQANHTELVEVNKLLEQLRKKLTPP